MPIISPELRDLRESIRADQQANELLLAKAKWEGISTYGVLSEWGDPREWGNQNEEVNKKF